MENQIELYMHCSKCVRQCPAGTSPRQYAALEIGRTKTGLQIWCKRHDEEVAFFPMDFEDSGPCECEKCARKE
jgi:hypothetical protein